LEEEEVGGDGVAERQERLQAQRHAQEVDHGFARGGARLQPQSLAPAQLVQRKGKETHAGGRGSHSRGSRTGSAERW
jgi:hypothetical protein